MQYYILSKNIQFRRENLKVYDLKTEYLTNPLGIDAKQPRFSWKIESDYQGVRQLSYHIIVKNGGNLVWDSGIVNTENSQHITYEGKSLESREQLSWQVTITTVDGTGEYEESKSNLAYFEMGLLDSRDWIGRWIEPEENIDILARKPVAYLRKTFNIEKELISARVYQTAHGLYDFWINGQVVTKDCFNPGLTSYYARLQYQVYDITSLLEKGINSWAIALADGWWRGSTGGTVLNNFGYKVQFIGQIELCYQDGTRETICTDESFLTNTGGLIASDMMMGDIFDANLEPDKWKTKNFDDRTWKKVFLVESPIITKLISTRSVPMRENEIFLPKVFIDKSGKRILDFGQNIAGYVQMKLRNCQQGQLIRLVHGEMLVNGCFSQSNINKTALEVPAFQEVIYHSAGNYEEEYCPSFSIFGFRYVWIDGYEGEIQKDDFQTIAVYSDMQQTGQMTTSNQLINQLIQNSLWSQKGNFLDVPVDCPTRERNSWTGDAQIYAPTAAYFMNVYPFFEKWLQDQSIEQYASGKLGITFPSTSSVHNPEEFQRIRKLNATYAMAGPEGNGNFAEDSVGWGDSAVWIPYVMYLYYGDRKILENQYETAKRWVDYMLACAKEHNKLYQNQPQYHHMTDGELDANYVYDTRFHFGEWNEPIKRNNNELPDMGDFFAKALQEGKPTVATAYLRRSSANLAEMAKIIGNSSDYQYYTAISERVKKVYSQYLIAENGEIEVGHQAAYVRALSFDLVSKDKKEVVLAQLIKEIKQNDYCLNTGFLSTPFLLPVLVDNGRKDLAFKILEQTNNPSWLHAVLLGATTNLERWDGMDLHEDSFNHYSYGAVCEFLFKYIGGIRPIMNEPGFKKFILKPIFGGSITSARAIYECPYGTIQSKWKIKGNNFHYKCTIPANTQAEIHLPNGQVFIKNSGTYTFEVSLLEDN
jgi:alpha-L-rhamnosidase